MPPQSPRTRSGPLGIASGGGVTLGSVLGITVRVDYSWVIIFALVTLSVSRYFEGEHPGWGALQYWGAGLATSLLFFVSIFLHEMGHSLAARRYGIEVASITLFIFGGVAAIKSEPKRPGEEFVIAVAGPAVSMALAVLFQSIAFFLPSTLPGAEMIVAIVGWLALINMALAIFNLVPGFPLDGGRVLRSIIWAGTGSFERATRIAAGAGQIVAFLFIAFGLVQLLFLGNIVGGVWMALIGWFLLRAAQGSVAQLAFRQAFVGVRAADILDTTTPYVSPGTSIQHLVNEYVLQYGRSRFLVYDGQSLRGLVTLTDIKSIPREEWSRMSVQAIMVPCGRLLTARPGDSLERIMQLLDEYGINQVPVVEGSVFYGLVTRETILRLLRSRVELGN